MFSSCANLTLPVFRGFERPNGTPIIRHDRRLPADLQRWVFLSERPDACELKLAVTFPVRRESSGELGSSPTYPSRRAFSHRARRNILLYLAAGYPASRIGGGNEEKNLVA
jgi:hypothetical protein